jgi:hypothetical protein
MPAETTVLVGTSAGQRGEARHRGRGGGNIVDAEDAVQRGQGRACLPGRGGASIWRDSRCRGVSAERRDGEQTKLLCFDLYLDQVIRDLFIWVPHG